MQLKTTTKQFLLGGALLATVLAIGCNNSNETKEEAKPSDSTNMQKPDTASIRPPTKISNQ